MNTGIKVDLCLLKGALKRNNHLYWTYVGTYKLQISD